MEGSNKTIKQKTLRKSLVTRQSWQKVPGIIDLLHEFVYDFCMIRICRFFAFSVPIGVTLVDVVGSIAKVDGLSMQPTLNPSVDDGDFVFLNKWAVRDFELSRGEVISLISPVYPEQRIIKRVIGLEGDVVYTMGYKTNFVRVPEGHCWVEGDHTGNSMDSNSFGPVPLGLVTAKATYVIWPRARWQSLSVKAQDKDRVFQLH